MKPGFQGVGTHWNQGFMTFRKARRTRIVMLMIPVRLESGLRTRAVTRRAGSTALVDAGGGFPRQ